MSSRFILLVAGYIRTIETTTPLSGYIPNPIKNLIYLFFPKKCTVYGIGRNLYNEMGSHNELSTFTKLDAFSSHLFAPNDICTGFHRYTIKTFENRIYSLGNNYNGDCGHTLSQKVTCLTEINTNNIVIQTPHHISSCVIGNGSNTMVFCMDDIVYATGINSQNQFGDGLTEYTYKVPMKITHAIPSGFHKLIQIECSSSRVLCLTAQGHMFAWGDNTRHQCGIESSQKKITEITPVPCDANIKQIRVGNDHNLCISGDNELYVFGSNAPNGACGVSQSVISIPKPTRSAYFKDKSIIFIATKTNHSLCIDAKHTAYLFGKNNCCQVSSMRSDDDTVWDSIAVFQKVNAKFKDVLIEQGSCGNNHTVLLTKSNELIGFGANECHQCSLAKCQCVKEPCLLTKESMEIEDHEHIVRVLAGDMTTLVITQ